MPSRRGGLGGRLELPERDGENAEMRELPRKAVRKKKLGKDQTTGPHQQEKSRF